VCFAVNHLIKKEPGSPAAMSISMQVLPGTPG
jgi:hypothetical protein